MPSGNSAYIDFVMCRICWWIGSVNLYLIQAKFSRRETQKIYAESENEYTDTRVRGYIIYRFTSESVLCVNSLTSFSPRPPPLLKTSLYSCGCMQVPGDTFGFSDYYPNASLHRYMGERNKLVVMFMCMVHACIVPQTFPDRNISNFLWHV